MLISPYNPYDRYRRRFTDRIAGLLVVLITLGVAGGFGFWMGGLHSEQKIVYLEQQLEEHRTQNEQMQTTLTELSAEAQTAVMRYDQLQETYQQAIPAGPVEGLVTLVKKQLDEGMDPQRLEFVIRSARPPRNCTEPETKRFVIATAANAGPASQVEIAEGAIVIKGSGVSATNAKGAAEAWYDPSKSVALEITLKDGINEPKLEKKAGVMPLHHSVVAGNREYRFTIEEGARSFAKVVFDSCDYP